MCRERGSRASRLCLTCRMWRRMWSASPEPCSRWLWSGAGLWWVVGSSTFASRLRSGSGTFRVRWGSLRMCCISRYLIRSRRTVWPLIRCRIWMQKVTWIRFFIYILFVKQSNEANEIIWEKILIRFFWWKSQKKHWNLLENPWNFKNIMEFFVNSVVN